MHDRELYARILGIGAPWEVSDVKLNLQGGEVDVRVAHSGGPQMCPECGEPSSGYDTRERRWRHLDTCQYRTMLVARVPRVRCPQHGVKQIGVPWAEEGSRFTALYEALVIDWLKEASISAVAEQMHLSWDEVDGIMSRAVRRGLKRRRLRLPRHIGVDETSFQKRHEYVTVVSGSNGQVLHVADGRRKEDLGDFFKRRPRKQLEGLKTVSMDMWEPYISATIEHVPGAETKIAFDKFHVAKHLGDAVDTVRRVENRQLRSVGDGRLKGTRYRWLTNPENMDRERWDRFRSLRTSTLRTARAWAYKERAMMLWDYVTRGWATKAWEKWYASAIRCRLDPVKRVARMIKAHLEGIITAIVNHVHNGRAEGINSVIQWLKYTARGYRNRTRFRNAIYFHMGGLKLYPAGLS